MIGQIHRFRRKSVVTLLFPLLLGISLITHGKNKPKSTTAAPETDMTKSAEAETQTTADSPSPVPSSSQLASPLPAPRSYRSAVQRLSLGISLGGGGSDFLIKPWSGYVKNAGMFEGYVSLGIDVYNSCFVSKGKSCVRVYVLAPEIGAGYYVGSQLPFFQAGVGVGLRIHFRQWLSWLFEGGIAVKFSPIGTWNEQREAGILPYYRKDPADAVLPVGWLQTGMSFDLGKKLTSAAAQGVHLQVTVRIADGPAAYAQWFEPRLKSLDLTLLVGLRFYFSK